MNNNPAAVIERLDNRQLLSAVTIDATPASDTVVIGRLGPAFVITINGTATTVPDSTTTSLTINALGGDDTVRIDDNDGREITIDPGAGKDRIEVDGGPGLVRLLASPGDDEVRVNSDNVGTAELLLVGADRLERIEVGLGGRFENAPGSTVELATNTSVNFGDIELCAPMIETNSRVFDGRTYYGNMVGSTTPGSATLSLAAGCFADQLLVDYGAEAGLSTVAGVAVGANDLVIAPQINGDGNLDGRVDLADFGILRAGFGLFDQGLGGGDFNGDGIVDLADFGLLRANFGRTLTS
ncbi:MAG: hypothetical protein AAF561_05795 [Planctomycetota bacterium]